MSMIAWIGLGEMGRPWPRGSNLPVRAARRPRSANKRHMMRTIGRWTGQPSRAATVYQIADRLHTGRRVRVSSENIAATVSGWLAELGAQSLLVDDLASAVRSANWPAAHALEDLLSVDVTVAAVPLPGRFLRWHAGQQKVQQKVLQKVSSLTAVAGQIVPEPRSLQPSSH